jgi:hypothetical protein
LPMYLLKHHDNEIVQAKFHVFLTSEVNGHLTLWSLYSRSPQYSLIWGWVEEPRTSLDVVDKRRSRATAGNRT